MRRKRRNIRTIPGMPRITIDGKAIALTLARMTYRCEICNGPLKQVDFGLKCIDNAGHRGFIPKKLAEERLRQQAQNIEELPYKIVNGRIEPNAN